VSASTEPCTSGLEDEPELLHLARLDLLVQVLEGYPRRALALELLAVRAHGGDLPRLALVGHHEEGVPACGTSRKPENLHRVGRLRLRHLLAAGR